MSADDMMPILIYIFCKSEVPDIGLHIHMIEKMCIQDDQGQIINGEIYAMYMGLGAAFRYIVKGFPDTQGMLEPGGQDTGTALGQGADDEEDDEEDWENEEF